MTRPTIRPAVAAALTAAIPPRLIKKLDSDPTIADRWQWSGSTVTTEKGERVSLEIVDGVVIAVACSCLLAPKCLHVAATVSVLEPAESTGDEAAEPIATAATPAADDQPLSSEAMAAATRAYTALAAMLAAGAQACGAFGQGELLRAIHATRAIGLHRLAAAQTRVLRSIRQLRSDSPDFALATLTADLREALAVAHAITRGRSELTWIGRARRDYEPIGNLRLYGLFSEAVVARTGYAGVVTYLIDERGRMFTRADVAPGDVSRAAAAYRAPTGIGDAALPHSELARAGLFVAEATASRDGRLGAGQRVRAVRAADPSRWDVLANRFAEPLATQLVRIGERANDPEDLRPAGWDLVFVEGVAAVDRDGPSLVSDLGPPMRLTTALDHPDLAARDNLAALVRASGSAVRVVARVRLVAARLLDVIALAPLADGPIVLDDGWHGRANLHYDRLTVRTVAAASDQVAADRQRPAIDHGHDLLDVLRRRIERAALGGLATVPTHAIAELGREAKQLIDRAMPTGAAALHEFARAAHPRDATVHHRFASAWLRAALYDDAARRRLAIACW